MRRLKTKFNCLTLRLILRKNYYYDFISSNFGFIALVVSDIGVVISSTPEKKLEHSLMKINEFGYKLIVICGFI